MSFSEKAFVNVDTLFQFVDCHLFALLIEMKDQGEHEFLDFKTYEEIYRHIRESVDLCHRDGVIKDEVAINPEKYIVHDPGLIPMLKKYRDAGVKLFLLTNSYWEYTSTAMNYLLWVYNHVFCYSSPQPTIVDLIFLPFLHFSHGKKVDDATQKKNEWTDLFDLV